TVGVSMPNGIAVTSVRPVRFISERAIHVYARSPASTPRAVPGTILPSTRSAGKPKMPISAPERMTRTPTLSRASPRNPFRSPGPSHAGLRRAGGGTGEIPHGLPGAFGEITTPLQLASMIGDGSIIELDRVSNVITDADARAVRLPFALVATFELDFRVEIFTLGVRSQQ